jgi:hypothetical protein
MQATTGQPRITRVRPADETTRPVRPASRTADLPETPIQRGRRQR